MDELLAHVSRERVIDVRRAMEKIYLSTFERNSALMMLCQCSMTAPLVLIAALEPNELAGMLQCDFEFSDHVVTCALSMIVQFCFRGSGHLMYDKFFSGDKAELVRSVASAVRNLKNLDDAVVVFDHAANIMLEVYDNDDDEGGSSGGHKEAYEMLIDILNSRCTRHNINVSAKALICLTHVTNSVSNTARTLPTVIQFIAHAELGTRAKQFLVQYYDRRLLVPEDGVFVCSAEARLIIRNMLEIPAALTTNEYAVSMHHAATSALVLMSAANPDVRQSIDFRLDLLSCLTEVIRTTEYANHHIYSASLGTALVTGPKKMRTCDADALAFTKHGARLILVMLENRPDFSQTEIWYSMVCCALASQSSVLSPAYRLPGLHKLSAFGQMLHQAMGPNRKIEDAVRAVGVRCEYGLFAHRAIEVAIGLQSLALPVLLVLEILDVDHPNTLTMFSKWRLIAAVKHFR